MLKYNKDKATYDIRESFIDTWGGKWQSFLSAPFQTLLRIDTFSLSKVKDFEHKLWVILF